jgi:gentisate 1,2-dioxygenase
LLRRAALELAQPPDASDGEEAILFSINDRPMMEALNLYREEAIGDRL